MIIVKDVQQTYEVMALGFYKCYGAIYALTPDVIVCVYETLISYTLKCDSPKSYEDRVKELAKNGIDTDFAAFEKAALVADQNIKEKINFIKEAVIASQIV